MVNIVAKKIGGREYLYLVTSIRKGDRVIQKTIKYIGKKRPILKEEFECMQMSYSKKDWVLHGFDDQLSYQDHNAMRRASELHKKHINGLDETSKTKEKERFLASFITNSNTIEGSTLTKEETFNFLFNDMTPKGRTQKELFMASNLFKAWQYVEANCRKFPTKKDFCELHRIVNKNMESEKTLGKYKIVQNYVGDVNTSSYLFVEENMTKLSNWVRTAFKKVDDFEVAFQSHAQFEIIHPFIDGNGRVGRLLMNWLLMYRKLAPFAIRSINRADYILALNNSRKGSIAPICRFCFDEYLGQHNFL